MTASIDDDLLAILACPSDDHAPLRRDGDTALVCTFCASRFRIDGGIPVLLADDAIPGPNGLGVRTDDTADTAGTSGPA